MAVGSATQQKEDFEALARAQLPRLYSLARRLVGDRAEDLVQECLMRAYRSFGSLSAPGSGGRWMQSILVNTFRDGLRRQDRRIEEVAVDDIEGFSLYRTIADEDPFPYSDSLHLDFLRSFGREDVHEVLMRMPDLYRAPLVRAANYPGHRTDGIVTPDFRGVLETDDGAVILIEWNGFARSGADGVRELVGRMTHLTDDARYSTLNDRQCAVAGEVRPKADGSGFDVVIEVAELVWEPLGHRFVDATPGRPGGVVSEP